MNREEAIRIFRKEIECLSHAKCEDCILEKVCDPAKTTPLDSEYIEAYGMAIQALSQEPCDDAVSREAVIKILEKYNLEMSKIAEDVSELPSVTQKSGKWVEIDDEPHEVWECDHCGFVIDGSGCIEPYEYRDIYKYCPNCGCRMAESEE